MTQCTISRKHCKRTEGQVRVCANCHDWFWEPVGKAHPKTCTDACRAALNRRVNKEWEDSRVPWDFRLRFCFECHCWFRSCSNSHGSKFCSAECRRRFRTRYHRELLAKWTPDRYRALCAKGRSNPARAREYVAKWRERNREFIHAKAKRLRESGYFQGKEREAVSRLLPWYVRKRLVQGTTLSMSDIPADLVELKRAQIKLHRILNAK